MTAVPGCDRHRTRQIASRQRGAAGRPGAGQGATEPAPGNGDSCEAIADAAGVSTMTVHAIVNGTTSQVGGATAAALLAVTPAQAGLARVDAGGTRLRLRALQVMGHGSARVARAIGAREQTIQKVVRGDQQTVTAGLRQAVTWLYDRWWDKRAPERSPDERGAASAARHRAMIAGWCAGAGLDDAELDVPGYQPLCGWRRAAGTGIAADIEFRREKEAQPA